MAGEFYINNVTGTLDVDAFVQSMTMNKQMALQKLSQERALRQAKASALSNLLSGIKDLQEFTSSMNIENAFKGKKVSISDSTVLSAQASDTTPNLILKLKVIELSQAEMRVTTGGVANLGDNLSPSIITLRYYTDNTNYTETAINFSGGTLSDLVSAINNAQNKIQASVFYDGSRYKLLLAEKDVGASTKETSDTSAVIEVSGLPTELGSTLDTLQQAKNAKLRMGSDTGPILESPTNVFKNVVSGLEVTAKKTSDTFINLEISDDFSGGKKPISDLLGKINSLLDLLNPMIAKGGLFQGNATFVQIKTQLFTLTKPLQELGLINLSEEGKYSLNSEVYDSLMNSGKIENVKRGLNNIKSNLTNYLEGLSKTFDLFKRTEDQAVQNLEKRAQEIQLALTKEQQKLRITFSKIEALMNKNEALKSRLEAFAKSLSEISKS